MAEELEESDTSIQFRKTTGKQGKFELKIKLRATERRNFKFC